MLTKSTSSADAMEVRLVVLWQVEIHYQVNVLSVNTTRCLKHTKRNTCSSSYDLKCVDVKPCSINQSINPHIT